jgi:Ohr subfamily peroxiredoxin
MSAPVYTAIATSTGDARAGGHTTSSDGLLDLTMAVPKEMGGPGGGPNPELLFAAGYATCFHSALKAVAASQKITISDSAVIAEIGIGPNDKGGYELSGALHVELGGVDQETADKLVEQAHQVCPYSNATRGNVDITVDATVA